MVKGWLAVSLGFGGVLVAPVLHSVIYLISTLTWGAWERQSGLCETHYDSSLHTFFDTIYLLGAGESRADWNYSGRFYTTTLIYCLSMPWIESDGVAGPLRLALRPFQWPWLWRHFLWACWWIKWNQTYLSDISGELLHIQYLNFPLLFLCFSFPFWSQTLPEHCFFLILGPLDLFLLTHSVTPEGGSCGGVWNAVFFLLYVNQM